MAGCDGIDNDCDEFVDDLDDGLSLESASVWFEDFDGDFWTSTSIEVACSPLHASRHRL